MRSTIIGLMMLAGLLGGALLGTVLLAEVLEQASSTPVEQSADSPPR
jgi:hypothetical protein